MSFISRKVFNTQDPSSFDLWKPRHRDHNHHLGETISVAENRFVEVEIEWKETPQAIVLKAHLPGFEKRDVKIELEEGNILCISGEKVVEKEEKADRWFHAERARARFSQPFKLPESAIIDRLDVHMEHGVLTITVPKREMFNSRRMIRIP